MDLRVADALTGEPIEGAQIAASREVLEDRRLGELAPPSISDRSGRVRWCPPGRGAGRVVVEDARYAPASFRLPRGPQSEGVVLSLSRGGDVEGVVHDRHGAAEAGVPVSVPAQGRRFEIRTDRRGRYRLEHLPPGRSTMAAKWLLVKPRKVTSPDFTVAR